MRLKLLAIITVFWIFTYHPYASSNPLFSKIAQKIQGPNIFRLHETPEFNAAVQELSEHSTTIQTDILSNTLSNESLMAIGQAIQYLPFERYLAWQQFLLNAFLEHKISEYVFKQTFILPLRDIRRGIFLFNHPSLKPLISRLQTIHTIKQQTWFDHWQSGQLMLTEARSLRHHYPPHVVIDDIEKRQLSEWHIFLVYSIQYYWGYALFGLASIALATLLTIQQKKSRLIYGCYALALGFFVACCNFYFAWWLPV